MPVALDGRGLGSGKLTRLHRMLYPTGGGNGRALFLPYDHGLEHGPRDFAGRPDAADPAFVLDLAVQGGCNGVALHIGQARAYYPAFAGRVPLVVKLNGKTEIPPDDAPLSPLNSTVEEAVALGADAVGYTLYVGSPRQDEDFAALCGVRQDAERFGMPLIVWSYPRGAAIEEKGGRNSFYAIDYAARVAAELGADVVKVNWPAGQGPSGRVPVEYGQETPTAAMLERIVRSAGRTLVLFSGGDRMESRELLERTGLAMRAGALGMIVGRNFLQRERGAALDLAREVRRVLGSAS